MKRIFVAVALPGAFFVSAPLAAQSPSELAGVPRAVEVARATEIPKCSVFVDAAAAPRGDGALRKPHKTIAAAVTAAAPGAVICVAEGVYAEQVKPGDKHFTLAGGFQRGKDFKVRDSAAYVSKAQGKGGSFLRVEDAAPEGDKLTAVDGFEITGYSQAIVREYWESQRFDLTNNHIHGNKCANNELVGGGFALVNVSGRIDGNVFRSNACGRGGAGFVHNAKGENTVTIERNLIDDNHGTEPDASHGGGLYLFGTSLRVIGNRFTRNSVTKWGGALFVGAYTAGGEHTTANLNWNVYLNNRAGVAGGGFFCDDGASCRSYHEIYYRNCGGNIFLDSGGGNTEKDATNARFDHLTNAGALAVGCEGPGEGVRIDRGDSAPDRYSFVNAIFWGNAPERDLVANCDANCGNVRIDVNYSMVQTKYGSNGLKVNFGEGIVPPADPLFADVERGDFHLRSTAGRWTPNGRVNDPASSPALGKGLAAVRGGENPERAEPANELGAFGNSIEASYSRAGAAQAQPVKSGQAPRVPSNQAPPVASNQAPPVQSNQAPPVMSDKEAFEAARTLGTAEAWDAFLASYPTGFYADLARAYLVKLGRQGGPPAAGQTAAAGQTTPAVRAQADGSGLLSGPGKAAISRGASYMGFPERFNRYYTDPAWKPSRVVYVSPRGGGDGTRRDAPTSVQNAVAAAQPGTQIYFTRGEYTGCFGFTKSNSGTYDEPIVLYAERNEDRSIGVSVQCCGSGRQTCFNFEDADYIAVDGFELIGGRYGVRAVGADFAASKHSRGIAALNCVGHDQYMDPFFSGHVDWAVWEGNVAYGAKEGDGHGIYLSNGGDWNIVRYNETYGNFSSDFQINADPASTCQAVGIRYDDPRCDAYAGEGEGGQGASDYFLVDSNHFHSSHGPGPNFTSVRRSVIRNNIFGPQARHNVSFWQETDNPKLGSSDNKILHNLFITTARHGVQFANNSTRNEFANNVLLGIRINAGVAVANPSALLMEVDDTVGENVYRSNLYVSGKLEGRAPGSNELTSAQFSPAWFAKYPAKVTRQPNDFTPSVKAPFLAAVTASRDAPFDRNGVPRTGKVTLGPIETP